VTFINDSKATTLESLTAALNSFQQPIVLIAGGKDKGADFDRIRQLVSQKVRHAILIGAAAKRIAGSWTGSVPITMADTMEAAVKKAIEIAVPQDVVLLSPACSSFDMFQDFEDRGKIFKKIVNRIKQKHENK
jgi:UDP-N-acetylmuramoylalanine--D-glutamate ligase